LNWSFFRCGIEYQEQLLSEQYGKTKDISYYITDQVWKIYTEKRYEEPNLRVARDVAILTNNDRAVIDPILEV